MIDAEKLLEQKPMARMMALAEPMEVFEPITLEEAKHHLNVVYDDDDAYISSLIVAARRMAEGKTNRTITQRSITQFYSGYHGIRLLKPPFVSVDSISYFNEAEEEVALNTSDFMVGQCNGTTCLIAKSGFVIADMAPRPGAMKVVYTAGYPVGQVPEDLIHWMKLQIGSMYAHRESVIAGVSVAPLPDMYEKMFLQPYMVYE